MAPQLMVHTSTCGITELVVYDEHAIGFQQKRMEPAEIFLEVT